jgi:hypothetical protein
LVDSPQGRGSKINGPKRRERVPKNLRRAQGIDNVIVEKSFEFTDPRNGKLAGEGCYVSATVLSKRYYGVLVDQPAMQIASHLHFEEEAAIFELNQKMKRLKKDTTSSSASELLQEHTIDGANVNGKDTNKKQEKIEDENGAEDETKYVPLKNNEVKKVEAEQVKHKFIDEQLRGIKDTERLILKYQWVESNEETGLNENGDSDYGILLATFVNADAAADGDKQKAEAILSACKNGGGFVDEFFYQYKVCVISSMSCLDIRMDLLKE